MASVLTTFTTFGTAARAGSLDPGNESWGTTANAQTSNDVRAIFSASMARPWGTAYTFYLTAKQLTDLVPAGSTIDGIKVTVEKGESLSDAATWTDSAVYIIKGGTVQTAQNKATATVYTVADVAEVYGGAADLWGQTWAPADVNGAGFGVAVSCGVVDGMFATSVPRIDAVTVEVFYTLASGAKSELMMTGVGA